MVLTSPCLLQGTNADPAGMGHQQSGKLHLEEDGAELKVVWKQHHRPLKGYPVGDNEVFELLGLLQGGQLGQHCSSLSRAGIVVTSCDKTLPVTGGGGVWGEHRATA